MSYVPVWHKVQKSVFTVKRSRHDFTILLSLTCCNVQTLVISLFPALKETQNYNSIKNMKERNFIMTQKRKNSLHTGREGRKALTARERADLRWEEDMLTGSDAVTVGLDVMDTAVIAMVNLYLKSLSSSERYIILKNVVRPSTEDESGVRAHIDGAKLAELIDMAKAYLAELLNVNITAHSSHSTPSAPYGRQPKEPVETVFDTVIGVDMSNTNCEMIGSAAKPAGLAAGKERVVRVDDIDDDGPKYNPALDMSFDNLINKSWTVLFDLMKNLSGTEYVTHMPYEMAEMIAKHYYKLL